MKDNATTVVGWLVVVSLSIGGKLATMDVTEAAQLETQLEVESNGSRLTALESDVRLLAQTVHRQEQIVTRQEKAQQDLDRLVVELRTVVEVQRDGD